MIRELISQYKKWKPRYATKNALYHLLERERKRSFGACNPDEIYYVIRPIHQDSYFCLLPLHCLLANYFYVLSHLAYAQEKGWIPLIDQESYPVYNRLPDPVDGTRNAWEYYWQQPGSRHLAETYQSQHVVLSKRSWFYQWDLGYEVAKYHDKGQIHFFHELAECVPLQESMRAELLGWRERLFAENGRVLGVSFRFGGHATGAVNKGLGHPIQPTVVDLIAITRDRMDMLKMEYVFLASDEQNAVDEFKNAFRERLIVMPRLRANAGKSYTEENDNGMYASERMLRTTREYLIEMELLAQCNGLIGSITSGLRYAIVKNDGRYEYMELLDRGRFPDPRKRS